jgi:hypothetical protein
MPQGRPALLPPSAMAMTPTPVEEAPQAFVVLKRVPVKESLRNYGTDTTILDQPWLLTAIALAHYALFPLGVILAWTLFSNSAKLGSILGAVVSSGVGANNEDPTLSVFLLIVGHLLTPAGVVLPVMMHEYEYWQIAEMKNPVSEETGILASYNNQRLYTIAITMMLNTFTIGHYAIAAAVFGVQSRPMFQIWGLVTILVLCAGPEYPKATTVFPSLMERFGMEKGWNYATNGGKPVFPVSIWKSFFFIANTTLCVAALVQLLGSATTPLADVPVLRSVPGGAIAALPLILNSFGGIWEGIVAESRFDQRHHLFAGLLFSGGYFLYIPLYQNLLR